MQDIRGLQAQMNTASGGLDAGTGVFGASQSPLLAPLVGQPTLEVAAVRTRRERDSFVRLPWRIYAQDAQWVPPLMLERKEFIHPRRHPFYRHGQASLFLARRGAEVVGRIMASDDPLYNRQHASNLGCFGMFESIDDPRVADGLLTAAADWLRARGRSQILGPIDYSTNYACGLLIDGFDTPPRVMMNHNPPYYARLLENWGLQKAKDLFSWWFDDALDMGERWRHRAARLAERGKIVIRPFRVDDLDREIQRCKAIYNGAWEKNWGFVQMTDAEFTYLARDLVRWALPEFLLLAEVDSKPVGFCMTLPDLNEAIGPLNGRIFSWGLPVGWLKFRQNRRKIRTARLVALGVLEEYRRRGVVELMILRTLEYGKDVLHYTGAELGWTLEDNDLINRAIETVGARRYKTFRIYERAL